MNSKTALEKKYEIIKQNLGNQTTFYTDEVIPLFPELKKSTLYWNLSKLVEAGYIKRVRNGVFSFNDLKGRQGIILCETAQKLKNYMDELGFYYYISGLDILAKYMLHIPEQYPVIAFIEKAAKEEIYNNLLAEGFDGEPDMPIRKPFRILTDKPKNPYEFQYMMLSRLQSDCEYYLNYGNRCTGHLYYHNESKQIAAMKKLWNEFPDDGKPEWLTWKQILEYEKAMCSDTK